MKKDKKVVTEEETTTEENVQDEDLKKLYDELENDSFTNVDEKKPKKKTKEEETDLVEEEKEEEPEEKPEEEKEDTETKEEIEEKVEEPKEKTTKKGKIKWQSIFNLVSMVFLIGCVIFYGYRLVKYYKIYNPKGEDGKALVSVGAEVKEKNPVVTKDDGLYNVNGEFVFKGTKVNNYVKYSNMLWRIVKVNKDNTVLLVTDEVVNNLAWDNDGTDYLKSDITKWLNASKDEHTGIFESVLNDKAKYLNEMSLCVDTVDDLKNIVCSDYKEVGYLGILGITDYANSVNEDSYLNNTENIWLYNTSKDKVWNVTNGNITSSESSKGYGVKATVMLKNNVTLQGGKGTKEEPYLIETKAGNSNVGKYVQVGGAKWTIYEDSKDMYRLVLSELYDNGDTTYKFSSESNKFDPLVPYSLAYHLNNTIYKKLNSDAAIIDCDWYVGAYSDDEGYDYTNVYDEKVTSKVGLYNVADIKLNNDLGEYFYLTPDGTDKVFGANSTTNLYSMRYSYMKSVRPAICIKKGTLSSDGTYEKPFVVKAEEDNNEKE